MTTCPGGKTIEKILGVASVDGLLTFLVQWNPDGVGGINGNHSNNKEENDDNFVFCGERCSMIRAATLRIAFPQEVIKFYEKNIRFRQSTDSAEVEKEKARRALAEARRRKDNEELQVLGFVKNIQVETVESSDDDDVEKAIKKEERKYDKFNLENSSDSEVSSLDDSLDSDDDKVLIKIE